MKLQLRKRKKHNFRKLIKVDLNGNVIDNNPIYVLLNDVEGNVENEGTAITPEVVEKVNWKDETSVEFIPLTTDTLPEAKEDVVQIVSKSNGEIWCIPTIGVKGAFPLGNSDFENLLKKYETNYARGKTFEFFVLDKEAKIFANRTRIGSIPKREIEDTSMEGGTYIDMNNTGNIVMFINGEKSHEFTKDKVLLKNHNSTMGIDSTGIVKLEAKEKEASVKIIGPTFSISSNNTDIEEANNTAKFNCHTKLDNASYGNHNLRLQFYPNYIRLQDVSDEKNSKEIFRISKDGTISIKNEVIPATYPMGFAGRNMNATWGEISKLGNLITAWTYSGGEIQFRQLGSKLYVGIDGTFYQNEGNYRVVDENSVNNYIKNYFDTHFKSYFDTHLISYFDTHFKSYFDNYFEEEYRESLEKYENRKVIFDGSDYSVYMRLSDNTRIFEIQFSTTPSGQKRSLIFKGTDIGTSKARYYDETQNCYYKVHQYIANDDQYDDYIQVYKEDENGSYLGREYIRVLYEF